MNGSEAAGDLVLIQPSLIFLCKCRLVSITTTLTIYMMKTVRSVSYVISICYASETTISLSGPYFARPLDYPERDC